MITKPNGFLNLARYNRVDFPRFKSTAQPVKRLDRPAFIRRGLSDRIINPVVAALYAERPTFKQHRRNK